MVIEVGDKQFRFIRIKNKTGSKVDTLCLVKFKQYPRLGWAFGAKARLNPIDKFNKAEGKRVALLYTLDKLGADKNYKWLAINTLLTKLPKMPVRNDLMIT